MARKKIIENEDKISLPSSSEDELLFAGNSSDDDIASEDDSKEEESSDSDGAPEMVSFKSALENSKLLRKHTAEVIKTQKEERKRKRKEIQAKNLLQKEEKWGVFSPLIFQKQAIQQKKLPDDILENLEDHSVLKPKDLSFENEPCNFEENYEESGLEESTENLGDDETVVVHGPTVFKCKILSKESKKPKHVFEEAMNFKERALFGGRIRREKNSREAMLKISKQIAGGRRKAC
ncbi:hypothetical protein X975_18430, partial [Stegodyphus mimosarum]